MPEQDIPVLIVGGSLVGLSTALFLRRQGIDVVLVERHPGTSIHPRTPGYNARTMELFRAAGVEQALLAAGPWQLDDSGVLWAESLTSENYRWLQPPSMHGPREDFSAVSPSKTLVLSQDKVEPALREHAGQLGADLRFNTELASFTADADGVTAVLANRSTGACSTIRARYLVAADGADSRIRSHLGINRTGPGVLAHNVSVIVRADLQEALRNKRFVICQVDNPDVSAMVRIVGDRVSLNISYHPERGETVEQFTPQRSIELTRAVAGIPDLPVEPLDVLPYQLAASVADRFTDGRVFLVGDAAHVMPPSGAFGANTGIQDAYNLAWKLAFVLHGWAGPPLLDTYQAERRPVAELTVAQALARSREWFHTDYPAGTAPPNLIDDLTLMFGYRYQSPAILADPRQPAMRGAVENPLHPTCQPGTRMPHLWFTVDGQELSTVDLWTAGLVLLTGPGGAPWRHATKQLSKRDGLPLLAYSVPDSGTFSASWPQLGITPTGAILIRPDGFIAWRTATMPAQPEHTLDQVLHQVLSTSAPCANPS
jgi:putative polyketide hydroxylase